MISPSSDNFTGLERWSRSQPWRFLLQSCIKDSRRAMIVPRRQNPDVRIAFLTAGLGLLCLLPSMRGAITPTEWKHRQTFEIAHPGLTKIALPDATLDLTRAGFVDLRLMGPNGEEIPYAVHIPAPPTPTAHSPRNVAIELQPLST